MLQNQKENTMSDIVSVSTDASYAELRAAQDRINAEIAKVHDQARNEGVAKVVELIKEFSITPDELNRALAGKGKPGRKPGSTSAVKTGNANTGTKAPIKYRNPENTEQTWTGRGIAPQWIRDVPKDQRERFLVEQPAATETPAPEAAPVEAAPVAEAAVEPEAVAEVELSVDPIPEPATPLFNS